MEDIERMRGEFPPSFSSDSSESMIYFDLYELPEAVGHSHEELDELLNELSGAPKQNDQPNDEMDKLLTALSEAEDKPEKALSEREENLLIGILDEKEINDTGEEAASAPKSGEKEISDKGPTKAEVDFLARKAGNAEPASSLWKKAGIAFAASVAMGGILVGASFLPAPLMALAIVAVPVAASLIGAAVIAAVVKVLYDAGKIKYQEMKKENLLAPEQKKEIRETEIENKEDAMGEAKAIARESRAAGHLINIAKNRLENKKEQKKFKDGMNNFIKEFYNIYGSTPSFDEIYQRIKADHRFKDKDFNITEEDIKEKGKK